MQICIEVSGGVVTSVCSDDKNVNVTVIDYDDIETDTELLKAEETELIDSMYRVY
jgi:hypothetical protein